MPTTVIFAVVVAVIAALGVAFIGGAGASANTPVTGAAFTTVNESVDGSGHCQNGNPNNNCNIYDGKQYVWASGGSLAAALGDGTYFFAVLAPGGQADPNDGAANNLSDVSPTSNTGAGDAYTNRTFTVAGGTLAYHGTHDFDSNKIRLMGYDDTTNTGGVYIMAICSLAGQYPVAPSDCKYDAFKVQKGEVQHALPLTVTKDANGAYTNTYAWTIKKDADKTRIDQAPGDATFNYTVTVTHDGGTVSGVKVTGTIAVFNPNVDETNVTVPATADVTDVLSDGTACTVMGGSDATLSSFETDFAYSCDLNALPQGGLNNTATVTWSEQLLDNGTLLDASSANFTFKSVSFTATPVDNCTAVNDSYAGSLGTVCVGDANPKTFTYSRTVSGTPGTCAAYDNTATFTTNTTGTTDSAGQTVKLCEGADVTVTKTATPDFKRTYHWTISKDVDKTLVKQVGGSATFNYTVKAAGTGFTDSDWAVAGKITVTNPNDWEAVTVDVADAINNGGNCTVTGGSSVSIAASDSHTFDYTCSYSSAPDSNNGTNTATATWDATAANTTHGSATGTAGANFDAPTSTVNKTVTISDSYAGALGTLTAVDSEPFTSGTFKYTRVISIPSYGCLSYDNTAKIVETGQSASKTVTVCGPVKTGALTMGFWQNKNGQGIITSGASTSGVCNSGTWLRQYAPFQDLSATASCAQAATYVFNVVKAANASGSSMNAMLKAQDLATSLDVYFSDSTLGGNKIGAPAPVGGVAIDLTKVCSNPLGCTNYINAGPSFSGATSLTVSQIVAYEASQSNAGGSTWYGNNKSVQELAKDSNDAINNQVAFGA